MKISILTPDLSRNCLGRAYLLAKMLQKYYDVEIIGPMFGNGIWNPVANDTTITYKSIKINSKFGLKHVKELINLADGDVIYASKPTYTSFGVGLLIKFLKNRPLILDIDDWEMGFIKENFKNSLARFKSLVYWQILLFEKLYFLADEITVSNSFLQKKFGGTIIWHGRDAEKFNPEKYDCKELRKKYHIEKNKKIIMFFGTPRPHKGVDDLLESVRLINNQDIILVIVGIDISNQYCKELIDNAKNTLNNRFIWYGLQPFEKIPEILSIANVVVIPQRESYSTVGQMPAKVFDAMAMAKPIIATKVSDLPEVLKGCGWIVEPGNPKRLAETIELVLDDDEKSKKIGWKARDKFIKKYSWNALEKKLVNIFKNYEK
ncbi:glycosyltransferase family 4 protein [Methanothermococcus sp.]|uniref:glycosyltransferase family 4 protein n=1 Tax=Methanothermococcus sp. TaxID=2614238 RepID=UPI0025D1BC16|nr:glycosyltransferase family 4 protein [Methanothermococcus sp.]